MRRLLITGAGGFLGWNLCRELGDRWEIVGTVRSRLAPMEGIQTIELDLTHAESVRELFHTVRPHALIHAAAAAKPDFCQLHPVESEKINVDASVLMASLCAERAIPMVFTSTDLVFDGHHPPYREEDTVSPVSIYGEQKAKAEAGILRRYPNAVVCRMALMFGDGGPHASSFLGPMIRSMQRREELRLFTDEVRTPLSGHDAAKGIALALERASGLLHLGGRERMSRYEFGILASKVFDLPNAVITPSLQRDVPTPAPRSVDVSLDSSRAWRLGFRPARIEHALKVLRSVSEPKRRS
jgi:dTDP-4-dehydrorhamnose reductase